MEKGKNGLIFVLPALVGTFIFIIIPIFCSFALSFTEWDLLNEIKFAGLANYKAVLGEKEFVEILVNTFVYAISTTFFAVIIPLLIASVLNSKIRGAEIYKTIYFLPFITPAVVIAIVWSWIFDPNIGLVNQLFRTNLNWLFDTHLAMPVLIFVSVWKLIGYNVVLFLTGFSTIDSGIYESAKIDGAGSTDRALVGGMMLAYAQMRGLGGFVINGAIRDLDEIRSGRIPVFAKGVTPQGPYREGPGEMNVPVVCGGQVVMPGDILVGDEDGVVVIPRLDASELLAAAKQNMEQEQLTAARMKQGTYSEQEHRQAFTDLFLRQGGSFIAART